VISLLYDIFLISKIGHDSKPSVRVRGDAAPVRQSLIVPIMREPITACVNAAVTSFVYAAATISRSVSLRLGRVGGVWCV
jgi:hypothetical protein